MNDYQRLYLGVVGTVTSFVVETLGPVAPICAALATSVFMAVSAAEKIRNWLKK